MHASDSNRASAAREMVFDARVAALRYGPSTRGNPTVLEQANGRNRDFEGRLARYCEANQPILRKPRTPPISITMGGLEISQVGCLPETLA